MPAAAEPSGDENWHVFRVDLDDPGAATVDLTPFARGELEIGSEAEPLAPVPFPVADDQEADNPDAANPKPANPLLATATVDVRIVASEPFVAP